MTTGLYYVIQERLLFEDRTVYYSEKVNGYVNSVLDATKYPDQISALNASTSVDEEIVRVRIDAEILEDEEEISPEIEADIIRSVTEFHD